MRPALAAFGLLTGCATILDGTVQEIRVGSEPPGATVRVENGGAVLATAVTPALLELRRRAPREGDPQVRFIFEKPGYEPVVREFEYKAESQKRSVQNLFTLGLGTMVDWRTGAVWAIGERGRGRGPVEEVRVDLPPLSSSR